MTNQNNAVVSPAIDVQAVFTALETWIKQRPGLEYGNYGALAPYRAELRTIANDKRRAIKALDEARGLQPARPELLADAFSAFSGRLQWCPEVQPCDWCPKGASARLEYTTGQYWPTEYRKAAAAVLERYIAMWRQAEATERPQTFTYSTTLHPAINPETWQIGDQVKSVEDNVIGTVIEVGYNAVKVQWEDGMTSQIGKRNNVVGRFERVA